MGETFSGGGGYLILKLELTLIYTNIYIVFTY